MPFDVEINPQDAIDFAAVRAFIVSNYAFMDSRIDPPSFIHAMSVVDVAEKAQSSDFYVVRDGTALIAVGFGKVEPGGYEIGKLAVSEMHRGQGLARRILDAAAQQAKAAGETALQLYARVELTENHAIYRALGFEVVDHMIHPGFDRPTAYLFRRPI